MLHRYGTEHLRIDNNDIRRREMMTVGSSNKHIQRKQYSLNTTITLLVNKHEEKHLRNRGPEVGFFWYEADKRKIFLFVWGRVTGGLPALHAIQDYYAMHHIEEDDFAIETAERLWKRWRVEKEKTAGQFGPQVVPHNVRLFLSDKQGAVVYQRVSTIIDRHPIEFNKNFSRSTVYAWILCDLCGLTHEEAGNRLNRGRSRITESLQLFRNYLDYNQDLRKIIAYCLATTRARPTPST